MVEGSEMETKPNEQPVNTRKFNIGTKENMKLAQIENY
jgi:hypothetical protein